MEEELQPFFARRRSSEGQIVVELGGDCDASALEAVNETLSVVVAERPRRVVVDLALATLVDSLTLGSLIAAAKRVRADGGSFAVVGVAAPEVRRAFEVTGLDRWLVAEV